MASVLKSESHGWTLLHEASEENDMGKFREAVGSDVPVESKLSQERKNKNQIDFVKDDTPLHIAAICGSLEVANALLSELEAATESVNCNGETPLHRAAYYGKLEIVELLLRKKACSNCENTQGWTPFHLAADQGHLDVMKLLAENGAAVQKPNKLKTTPLVTAEQSGRGTVVKFLELCEIIPEMYLKFFCRAKFLDAPNGAKGKKGTVGLQESYKNVLSGNSIPEELSGIFEEYTDKGKTKVRVNFDTVYECPKNRTKFLAATSILVSTSELSTPVQLSGNKTKTPSSLAKIKKGLSEQERKNNLFLVKNCGFWPMFVAGDAPLLKSLDFFELSGDKFFQGFTGNNERIAVFVPSWERGIKGTKNEKWHQVPFFEDLFLDERFLVHVVVRDAEFLPYCKGLQSCNYNKFVVLKLPPGLNGFAHARHHCVNLADSMGYSRFWMIDDSVRSFLCCHNFMGKDEDEAARAESTQLHERLGKVISMRNGTIADYRISSPNVLLLATKYAAQATNEKVGAFGFHSRRQHKLMSHQENAFNQIFYLDVKILRESGVNFDLSTAFFEDYLFIYDLWGKGIRTIKLGGGVYFQCQVSEINSVRKPDLFQETDEIPVLDTEEADDGEGTNPNAENVPVDLKSAGMQFARMQLEN